MHTLSLRSCGSERAHGNGDGAHPSRAESEKTRGKRPLSGIANPHSPRSLSQGPGRDDQCLCGKLPRSAAGGSSCSNCRRPLCVGLAAKELQPRVQAALLYAFANLVQGVEPSGEAEQVFSRLGGRPPGIGGPIEFGDPGAAKHGCCLMELTSVFAFGWSNF